MKKYYQLALVSFVILFLELLLIRLVSTEIRIFAYLSNFILLAIFIGSGIGMIIKQRFPIWVSAVFLFIIVLIINLGLFSAITDWLSPLNENWIWFQQNFGSFGGVVAGLLLTMILFFFVLFAFIPLGQYLGDIFENSQQIILVYSINVGASILGMWLFFGSSWLAISPLVGIIASQLILLFLSKNKNHRLLIVILMFLTATFGFGRNHGSNGWIKTVWSPYQKLSLYKYGWNNLNYIGYQIAVNGISYMGLHDLSNERRAWIENKAQELSKEKTHDIHYDVRFADQYALPYLLKPGIQDVLIIGAGGGNDVAAAVRANTTAIDAVEIDPQIVNLGKKYHPEQPYSSAKVNIIVDDGRSFFHKTNKKYDLVVMGLADSHTLSSSLTNVRLDHYLYTKESFSEVKKILKPNGLLYLSFEVDQGGVVGAKIAKSLTEAFGHKPLVFELRDTMFFGFGGIIFMAGDEDNIETNYLNKNPDLKKFITARRIYYGTNAKLLTDNWPYLYLDKPRLPKIYLIVSALLIAMFLGLRKTIAWQGKFRWDMFAMGAAFLLYEFQNVSKTSLLFGNTWTTNLFTITAILLFGLLANLIQSKRALPLKAAFAGLALAFVAQILVPIEVFSSLSFFSKAIWGSLFLNSPLFFSGVIFVTLFRDAKEKRAAFASNLLGSAAGGLLEIFSFLWGMQSLMFVALILYAAAAIILLRRRGLEPAIFD